MLFAESVQCQACRPPLCAVIHVLILAKRSPMVCNSRPWLVGSLGSSLLEDPIGLGVGSSTV